MSAAVVEPVDLPVVFGVSEYRLDRRLPFSVELFAEFGGEHSSHEGEPASGPAGSFAVAFAAVGRDQNREPVASGEVVHVLLVPVLSVGDDDRRLVGHAGLLELAEGGLDHRSQMREVAGGGSDLRRDRDLLLVHDGLGVVALDVAAVAFHPPRVRVGQVHLAGRDRRRCVGLARPAEPALVVQSPLLTHRLISTVPAAFRGPLVLQPAGRGPQPVSSRAGDRLGGQPPSLLELAVRLPQPTTPAVRTNPPDIERFGQLGRGDLAGLVLGLATREPLPPARLGLKPRREFVTARVTVLLILDLVGRDRLSDDLPSDPVKVNIPVAAGTRGHLRPVDRNHS
jgi:hypothetical protein